MINLTALKGRVKDLVETLTGLPTFYDIAPKGVKTGCLIIKGTTSYTGRTVDGDAHIATHSFDVFIFTFDDAEVCDRVTSGFVNATDGKRSEDFRLVEVNSITPADYDPDVGLRANMISIEVIENERH